MTPDTLTCVPGSIERCVRSSAAAVSVISGSAVTAGVSAPSLDVLCEAALDAGALGAKMSGGGRGGNMFALIHDADAERIARVLRAAGAVQVIKTRIGKS